MSLMTFVEQVLYIGTNDKSKRHPSFRHRDLISSGTGSQSRARVSSQNIVLAVELFLLGYIKDMDGMGISHNHHFV